jgi:hypothetical protein
MVTLGVMNRVNQKEMPERDPEQAAFKSSSRRRYRSPLLYYNPTPELEPPIFVAPHIQWTLDRFRFSINPVQIYPNFLFHFEHPLFCKTVSEYQQWL